MSHLFEDGHTTHYSAAELAELINAAEAIVSLDRTETPNLMLIRQRTDRSVGKVLETISLLLLGEKTFPTPRE